jgi:hypothetical protein
MTNFPDLAPGSLSQINPDFKSRLRSLLPGAWFPDDASVLGAILAGASAVLSSLYGLLSYTQNQTRFGTATGVSLEAKAADFLGLRFVRRQGESDPSFSLRVRREIVRPRNTRAAITLILQDLTGNTPSIFRPSNPADTGGYDAGGLGYDVAGGYGAYDMPFQALITIKRGTAPGANQQVVTAGPLSGYDAPYGGFDVGALEYIDGGTFLPGVEDADIYAAVASVTPVGHINWVRITN